MYEPTSNTGPAALTMPWMSVEDQDTLWAFLDSAPVALLAADDDREIVRVNARWCELTGFAEEQAVGSHLDEVLAPESRPGIEMRWMDLLNAGLATARVVVLRPDGARLAVRYGAFANIIQGV